MALLAVLRDAVGAGTHPPDLILRATADTARILTGADGIAIALRTEGVVVCRARSGDLAPNLGTALNVDSGISGECFRSSRILHCGDTYADDRVEPEVCRLLGIRSIAAVPLSSPTGTFGILEGFSSRTNAFTDEQIGFLKNLGEIAEAAYQRESGAKTVELAPAHSSLVYDAIPRGSAYREEKRLPATEKERIRKTGRRYWILSGAIAMVLLASGIVWWTWREPTKESTPGQPVAYIRVEASSVTPPPTTPLKPSPTITNETPDGPRAKSIVRNAAEIETVGDPNVASHFGVESEVISLPAAREESTSRIPLPAVEPPTVVLSAPGTGDKLAALGSTPVSLPTLAGRMSQGVTQASLLRKVEPAYPPEAMRLRLEGSVTLEASVAEDGTVREVKVLRGQPQFAAAAVAAVRQWRYGPSLLNGRPIPVQRDITIEFKLR